MAKKMNDDKIKLAEKEEFIDDYRYFPIRKLWKSHVSFFGSSDISLILGLSVLLIKLLSKTFTWPPSANKINFIDQLYSEAYLALERETLSSDLRILLSAIFSKTAWVDLDIYYQHESIKLSDNRAIKSRGEYILCLEEIQKRLESAQGKVINREPRQLVYINLDDLNESQNNFFEKL